MQPPQQDGFPNYNDPLPPGPGGYGTGGYPPGGYQPGGYPPGSPPPGGYPPGGYGPYPGGGPQLSLDTVGEAWRVVQPVLGTYIGAMVLAGLVLLVSLLPTIIVETQLENAGRTSAAPNLGLVGLALVFRIVSFVVQQFISGGLFRMAINHLRKGTPDLMDIFSAFDVLPSLVGAGILYSLVVGIGSCFCLIPGLLLVGLLMLGVPIIVDQKVGAFDGLSRSYEALKGQMWMALVYIMVAGLVFAAGFLLCGVGALVTGPIYLMTIALAYRNFFMMGGPGPESSAYPNSPIADPNY